MDLYADDLLLYHNFIIHDQRDVILLQLDIDKVADWVDVNHLTMNAAKCKVLVISHRRMCSAPEVAMSLPSQSTPCSSRELQVTWCSLELIP